MNCVATPKGSGHGARPIGLYPSLLRWALTARTGDFERSEARLSRSYFSVAKSVAPADVA